MKETFKEVMHNMGAVITWGDTDDDNNDWGLSKPGEIIHEAGTVRMGNDPASSALNKWNQAHECKNLFVVDGGPFVSRQIRILPGPLWHSPCARANISSTV